MKQHCPNCGGVLPPGVEAESVPLRPDRKLYGTVHEAPCNCEALPDTTEVKGRSARTMWTAVIVVFVVVAGVLGTMFLRG
jgi:hypothetical protein